MSEQASWSAAQNLDCKKRKATLFAMILWNLGVKRSVEICLNAC